MRLCPICLSLAIISSPNRVRASAQVSGLDAFADKVQRTGGPVTHRAVRACCHSNQQCR